MNEKIRGYAKSKKVKLWQLAECYGMRDTNFSKLLRHPLPPKEERVLMEMIEMIADEQETDKDVLNRLDDQGNSTYRKGR